MNKRLLQFITAENISQSQFADNIGVARASVSHIIAGRNKPGFDFVEKMARAFPALNIEWLITGRGKMYKSALGEQPQKPSTNDDYANDLFGDAYRDSLIATTVVQNGNDLLDSAFMDSITPSDAADGTTGNVKSDWLSSQVGTLTGTGGTSIAEKYDVRKGMNNISPRVIQAWLDNGLARVVDGNMVGSNGNVIRQMANGNYSMGLATG